MKLAHYEMILAFEDRNWSRAIKIVAEQFLLSNIYIIRLDHFPVSRIPNYRELYIAMPGRMSYSWTPEDSFIEEGCGEVTAPIASLWYPSAIKQSEILYF